MTRPNRFALLAALGAALAPAFSFAQQAGTARPTDPKEARYSDYVEAVVNDKVITRDQVRKLMDPLALSMWQQIQDQYTNEQEARAELVRRVTALEREIVHNLVDRQLKIEEFYKKGFGIPPSYLNRRFDDSIITRFKGDHEAYLRFLQANTMTEREYRKQLEEDDIVDYMNSQLRRSVTGISPGRIKDYYEKNKQKFQVEEGVKVRQITLKPVADETPDLLLQQANYIVKQARAPNADFAELARKYSNDEYARSGGLAGLYGRKQLQPVLEEAAFKLEPGQVSDPIVFNGNVYIFKCEEKHTAGIQSLDDPDTRATIEGILAIEDTRKAEQEWMERLRKNAYIHYNISGLE